MRDECPVHGVRWERDCVLCGIASERFEFFEYPEEYGYYEVVERV